MNRAKLLETEKFFEENKAFDWAAEFPQLCDNEGNFVGFDAIVGNPPYISFYSNSGAKLSEKEKNFFHQNYATIKKANERINTMNLFVELALKISKPYSSIAYILNKTFAVLPSYINTRKFVIENSTLEYFISDIKPFDAVVDCCIMGFCKHSSSENYQLRIIKNDFKTESIQNIDIFKTNQNLVFKFIEHQSIIQKINSIETTLSHFVEINRGVNIGGCFDFFLSSEKKNEHYFSYLSGTKCLKPYTYAWEKEDGYLIFDTKLEAQLRQQGKTLVLGNRNRFTVPKLFIPESSQQLMAAYSDEVCYSAYGIMVATQKNKNMDLKVTLALLNSHLMQFYVIENEVLRKGNKATPHIGVKGLNTLPYPTIDARTQNEIVGIVEKIISEKKINKNTSKYEKKINKIVYTLFDLTEDEISIIENGTN